MSVTWQNLDWEVLDRLRETFLTEAKSAGPYWHTITDLECYDFTYGERIGWKWDAVLAELKLRGWTPPTGASAAGGEPSRTILDWGCGSGIAGRRVVNFFGAASFKALRVFDHSPLAMEFAQHRARTAFPSLAVDSFAASDPIDLLVLSHVLNELDDEARAALTVLCARAQAILWVEPGTHEVSRALGGWRQRLGAAGFHAVAPCPHQGGCGVLAAGNERHWCHFFAAPPSNIYADSGWVRFGQRAGIDLRSLPYSFLALDRRAATPPAGLSRIIGEPRLYKGYAKIFNCDAGGVAELMLQKRDAPELFKQFHKYGAGPELHRWSHANGRINAVTSGPD